jgi:hypothetical protein
LSRLLQKFPFLVEAWYWALIYWVCISDRFLVVVLHSLSASLLTES